MITGFEVYCAMNALTLHFKKTDPWSTKSYDYLQMGGKVKCSKSAYEKKADKKLYDYAKFDTTRDLAIHFLSFISYHKGTIPTIGSLLEWKENNTKDIRNWNSRVEALNQNLKLDLMKIKRFSIQTLINPPAGKYPELINQWYKNNISLESLILLNGAYNIFLVWDKVYIYSVYKEIYIEQRKFWTAYSKFINVDIEKTKEVWTEWKT